MLRPIILFGIAVTAAASAGCAGDRANPELLAPRRASFGKTQSPTDPTASWYFPLADGSLGVKSDRQFPDASGTSSVYANGVCGVDATIFATTAASNSGDAVMQTDNPTYKDHRCTLYPRKLIIDYGDGTAPQATTVFINVHDIERENIGADQIPIGGSRLRGLNIGDTRCGGLVYHTDPGTTGSDSVVVTRTAADTWQVTTQPAPNDKAYCKADGQLYHIPVSFTIVSSRPLAAP